MAHKNGHFTTGSSAQDLSRAHATAKYMGKRHKQGRHKVGMGIGIALLVILAVGVGVTINYINNINSRLGSDIDSDVRDSLTEVRNGEPFYMLLLGIDKDEERAGTNKDSNAGFRSDSIMLARIDPKNVKVTLVSIHRDTYIKMGDYGNQKINAAYAFGGPSYAIDVISEYAGVPISHYAEIDMDGMTAVVDAVGGVDVNLPIPVKDTKYANIDLPAGKQHLDGETATALCRARHAYDDYPDGDSLRSANQRVVIAAVVKKVLKSDPATMTSTISAMADMIDTDLDVSQILSLASAMSNLDAEHDIMSGMDPTTSKYYNNLWVEICDTEAWKQMMDRVDQGLSPYAEGQNDPSDGISAQSENQPIATGSGDDAAADTDEAETDAGENG